VKRRDFRLQESAQCGDLDLKVKLGFLNPGEKSRGFGAMRPQHRVAKPPRGWANIEADPGESEDGAAAQTWRMGHGIPFAEPRG
jgi:hypothetical protein